MNFKKNQLQNESQAPCNGGQNKAVLPKHFNLKANKASLKQGKFSNHNNEQSSLAKTSPPKHYCTNLFQTQNQVNKKGQINPFQNIHLQEGCLYCPLQRCSPQKSNKAIQNDKQCLRLCGVDLDQFIRNQEKNGDVVFKSKVSEADLQQVKQVTQNRPCFLQQNINNSSKKQKEERMNKPPTPHKRKILQGQQASNYKIKQLKQQNLQFSDSFESSNLKYAIKHNESIYFLTIRLDPNSSSSGHWFYFKVKNPTNYDRNCRLIIINMTKSETMFGKGIKPAICRCGAWSKQGRQICYWKNTFQRKQHRSRQNGQQESCNNITKANDKFSQMRKASGMLQIMEKQKNHSTYYSLGFTIFLHAHQEIQVACYQPYTYSRLYNILDYLTNQTNQLKQSLVKLKRKVLAKSFLGNRVQLLTFAFNEQYSFIGQNQKNRHIDSLSKAQAQISKKKPFSGLVQKHKNSSSYNKLQPNKNIDKSKSAKQKRIILILGRSHPSQTASSFVIQGVIQQLLNLNQKNRTQDFDCEPPLKQLFEKYTFKVIPMINPDGVITGNSRLNCKGFDLNSEWKHTNSDNTAQIFAVKRLIDELKSKIVMVLDIHANLKTKGMILDGFSQQNTQNISASKQFAFILSKTLQSDNIFRNSRWRSQKAIHKQCEGTSTYALYKRLKINNILKISVSGIAEQTNYHNDERSLKKIGNKIVQSISVYFAEKNQRKFSLKKHFQQVLQMCLSNRKQADDQIQISYNSQSDLQNYNELFEKSAQGSSQKKKLKSPQNSQGTLSVYNSRNYYRVNQRTTSKNQRKISKNNQRSKSRLSRKNTQPKKTQAANDFQSPSQQKSMKNLSQQNHRINSKICTGIQSQRTTKKHESPIKIPKIIRQTIRQSKKSKSQSYQKPKSIQTSKTDAQRQNRIFRQIKELTGSNSNLKQILQASSQLKNSQVQDKQQNQTRSAAHSSAVKGKSIINADFMGEKQSPVILKNHKLDTSIKHQKNRISQVFQRAGVQICNKNAQSHYQILKKQNKMHNQIPRISEAIFKISNKQKDRQKDPKK